MPKFGDFKYSQHPILSVVASVPIFSIRITKYNGSSAVVKIPEKINGSLVTEIGKDAFRDCENLKEIHLPDSVQTIDRYAFCSCSNLEKIYLYASIKKIGENTFWGCTSLKEIHLPASVKKIDTEAFPKHAKIIRYENSTTTPEKKIIGCDNSTPLLEKIITLKKSRGISEEIVKELEKVECILKLDIEKLVRDIISDVEYIIKIQDTPTLESRLIDLLNSVSSNVQISKKNFYAETISPLEAHIKNNVKILTQSRSENESE